MVQEERQVSSRNRMFLDFMIVSKFFEGKRDAKLLINLIFSVSNDLSYLGSFGDEEKERSKKGEGDSDDSASGSKGIHGEKKAAVHVAIIIKIANWEGFNHKG